MVSHTTRPDRESVDKPGEVQGHAAGLSRVPHVEAASGGWQSPAEFSRQVAVEPSTGQHHNRLQSRPLSASAHKRKGWHAVQQGTAPQTGHTDWPGTGAAVYVRPDHTVNANISLDNSPSFPSLAKFADALPYPQLGQPTTLNQASKGTSWASPIGQKHHQQQHQKAKSPAASTKPAQRYSAALSPGKSKPDDSKPSDGMAMSDSELTNVTTLLSAHPWAEPGLARAVLAAANHNRPAADLLLREMEQHQAPSGSDSDEDLASHAIPPQTLALQPAEESQTVGPDHSPHTLKAPAPPALTGSSRNPSGRGRRQLSREEDKDVDLYYKYRGEALKLSRRWHKKLHQSATAFAAGQHSEGKALATEAHQVRGRAQAAHAEAALKIEHANNAHKGLGQNEIDLHGLHAVEAVEALDRRLQALGQAQHHSQAAKLRVIVGRGNNSSGGEASLPRVMESHLLQRNLNYIVGQGVITVYLRGLRH